MKTLALLGLSGKRVSMLAGIMNLFKEQPSDPLPDADARLALGALMVRVAKSDAACQAEDNNRIDSLLARMNGLGPSDAAKMRATCEKIEAAAPSTRKFALLIRETVSFQARVEAQETLWHITLANSAPNNADMALIAQVREALGLSKADCESAKSRAAPL